MGRVASSAVVAVVGQRASADGASPAKVVAAGLFDTGAPPIEGAPGPLLLPPLDCPGSSCVFCAHFVFAPKTHLEPKSPKEHRRRKTFTKQLSFGYAP